MLIVVPLVGMLKWLRFVLGQLSSTEFQFILYDSDTTPGYASVLSDFTQATFTGSAGVFLGPSDFTVPAESNPDAQSSFGPVAWTNGDGAPVTCYGFICLDALGELIFTGRFNSPVVFSPGVPTSIAGELRMREQ